jgi:hypothetical protein
VHIPEKPALTWDNSHDGGMGIKPEARYVG